MDMSITYCGLKLPHPFMPGASPLADELDTVKKLEDAGAAAIVLRSLFEEQILAEQINTDKAMESHANSFAEALSYFPEPEDFVLGPQEYLEQIRRVKQAVSVPIIASLNGISVGGWIDHAKLIEQAGADALELNLYQLATDADKSAADLEKDKLEVITVVKKAISIPVAVKLSPFYSSLPNFAKQLDAVGVDGLVIFNRFYQPDINVEDLEVESTLELSNSSELLVRLRWLSILYGRTNMTLAVTGGVHTALDAIKAIMCGAGAVQLVSVLLQEGPAYIAKIRKDVEGWLEAKNYESLAQMTGSMSLDRCPDRTAMVRANYMRVLQSWQPT